MKSTTNSLFVAKLLSIVLASVLSTSAHARQGTCVFWLKLDKISKRNWT